MLYKHYGKYGRRYWSHKKPTKGELRFIDRYERKHKTGKYVQDSWGLNRAKGSFWSAFKKK